MSEPLLIPHPVPGVFTPTFESSDPWIVTPETIEHARQCAQRLVDRMAHLPHSPEAGDALALALTVLHFTSPHRKGTPP